MARRVEGRSRVAVAGFFAFRNPLGEKIVDSVLGSGDARG